MATLLDSLTTTFLLVVLLSLSTSSSATSPTTIIQQACKASQHPLTCQATLTHSLTSSKTTVPSPSIIIHSLLSLSSRHLTTSTSMSRDILSTFSHHHNRSMAALTCLDFLAMSVYRVNQVSTSFSRQNNNNVKDVRAWASAALTYQYDCWSELSYVNGTRLVDTMMTFLESKLIATTSDALSMLMAWDEFGEDSTSWGPPKTERNGFWEREQHVTSTTNNNGGGLRLGKVDVTVCKEGKARGCYVRVQDAVNHAPRGLKGRDRYVIYIKEGVYEEIVRVPIEKTNLVFLGDGMGKTVITGSVNTGIMGISTYNTATVGIKGDGFMARGITFQNTAGPDAHQAVAFRSDSDFSLIENCEFLSNQDTLYAHSLRQVYRACVMEGNVDFIFGNAAAIFDKCTILVRPRMLNPAKGENNAVTAQGRTDPAQSTGFVFMGCFIGGMKEYMKLWGANPKVHRNYLGRPWKMYSRTVFIGCTMDRLISPEGWMEFRPGFALSTLYYGEFGNKGQGADVSKRVGWSSQIPKAHLSSYSARNFIQADEWSSGF